MQLQKDVSLKPYNTFGIDVKAANFMAVTTAAQLKEALGLDIPVKFVLSGGSNILLTNDIEGLVIHNAIKGIKVIATAQETDTILVKVNAGENWHEFVLHCIDNDWGGVENLSLIPGNVGTAPIQNIGAYGVELKDVFHSCEAVHRETLEEHTFKQEDCQFGYRDSIFKREAKDQYVITAVTFKLTTAHHQLHTQYGAIQDTLAAQHISTPTIRDISNAVIDIRNSKLPDPKKIGNSGSFFKNPLINQEAFKKLRIQFPEIPYYPVGEGQIKVPAGWLIEKAGFKGKRFGDAGVHDKQALVLVNHGQASGTQLWQLAMDIQETVKTLFGIVLQPEVNVIL